MEHVAQQLKGSGIDLAWWPLFLGSYQYDDFEPAETRLAENEDSITTCMRDLANVLTAAECCDFEETLP